MPTAQQIMDGVDSRLAVQLQRIKDAQDAHFTSHGRYWQGLPTHTVVPDGSADSTPDQWDRKAASETKTWRDMGGIPPLMRSRMQIDVYDGPQGKGYVLSLQIASGSETWERRVNIGPDAAFERLWFKHGPPPP